MTNSERKVRNGRTNSKKKLEQVEKENEKQYSLRMNELELKDRVKTKPLDLGTHFEVIKHIRLVPTFQEKEVDKIFFTLKRLLRI